MDEKWRKIGLLLVTMLMVIITTVTGYAAEPVVSEVSRTDLIELGQFEQILNTLRQMKNNMANGDYYFRDTGVRCCSEEEADALIQCFDDLFLADDAFILYYNQHGYQSMYVEKEKNCKGGYTYWLCGNGGDCHGIYAVWRPDADADELLRQHDEAKMVILSMISEAPEKREDKIRYYHDTLAGCITYDVEGYRTGNAKRSPYYGLVEGSCVCTGYAESFFNLCYYSGVPCAAAGYASIYSKDRIPDHKTTMINLDGKWKEVDVTWDDMDPGIDYQYFMREPGDDWQQFLNSPCPEKTYV